jgi:hypothetical protein
METLNALGDIASHFNAKLTAVIKLLKPDKKMADSLLEMGT